MGRKVWSSSRRRKESLKLIFGMYAAPLPLMRVCPYHSPSACCTTGSPMGPQEAPYIVTSLVPESLKKINREITVTTVSNVDKAAAVP
ncbi:hypothetical protein D3C75_669360 [compost metagenome]